ncbi:MAG: phosphate acyltransferase, partial [bacterium]
MEFLNDILYKASQKNNHIVLPEGFDQRIIKAAERLHKEKICRTTILGNKDQISSKAVKEKIDLEGVPIIDPRH